MKGKPSGGLLSRLRSPKLPILRVPTASMPHLASVTGDGMETPQSLISSGIVLPLWDSQLHVATCRIRSSQRDQN